MRHKQANQKKRNEKLVASKNKTISRGERNIYPAENKTR